MWGWPHCELENAVNPQVCLWIVVVSRFNMNTYSKVGLDEVAIDTLFIMLIFHRRSQRKSWIHSITSKKRTKGKFELLHCKLKTYQLNKTTLKKTEQHNTLKHSTKQRAAIICWSTLWLSRKNCSKIGQVAFAFLCAARDLETRHIGRKKAMSGHPHALHAYPFLLCF